MPEPLAEHRLHALIASDAERGEWKARAEKAEAALREFPTDAQVHAAWKFLWSQKRWALEDVRGALIAAMEARHDG